MKTSGIYNDAKRIGGSLVNAFFLAFSASIVSTSCKSPIIQDAKILPEINQAELSSRSVSLISSDGLNFKDHDKDGKLTPYEDWRLSPEERTSDLLARMTLEEKAGTMLHAHLRPSETGEYNFQLAGTLIKDNEIGNGITRLASNARLLATGNNKLQELAEERRLGIPLTISTDPRSHFNHLDGASLSSGNFSKWPEALGFGAVDDPSLTKQFANIARQEYRAVGLVKALSPMADLSTEPRWPRVVGTFGEDARAVGVHVKAYVEGFQGGTSGLQSNSVANVVKHWAGYGAAKDGYDSHSYYGRFAAFPGNNFDTHLIPFEGAFEAGVSGVMPTFSILEDLVHEGTAIEQVGGGYSKYLLTDLLRQRYGFEGIVLSDWAIMHDCNDICIYGAVDGQRQELAQISAAWGVMDLSVEQRYAKALNAGIDEFGGIQDPGPLINTVKLGLATEERLDQSVRRILTQKFELGLFENPFVDVEQAQNIVGNSDFQEKAKAAQARALVLLKNEGDLLPLKNTNRKVFLYGIAADMAEAAGFTPVGKLEEADLAIMRVSTPYEQNHKNYLFGRRQHEDNLAFKAGNPDYDAIMSASAKVPTIVTVFLERPAIMTAINDEVSALIGNFGISDEVLFSVLTGKSAPEGKLPIELPSSMEAVEAQFEDLPHDSQSPLYPYGFGLSYEP